MFSDAILLAGDKRFVDFDIPFFDGAVKKNLVAQGEHREVAFLDGLGANLIWFAVPDNGGVLLGDKAHFIDDFFGAELIYDADKSISDSDNDEEKILIRTNKKNHSSKDEIDKIKEGKAMFCDNLPSRVGHGVIIT